MSLCIFDGLVTWVLQDISNFYPLARRVISFMLGMHGPNIYTVPYHEMWNSIRCITFQFVFYFSGSRCQARDLKDLDRTESEIQFLKKQCQAVKITILAVRKSTLLSWLFFWRFMSLCVSLWLLHGLDNVHFSARPGQTHSKYLISSLYINRLMRV